MGFFDKLFGGTDKSAQKLTQQDNAQRQAFIEQMQGQTRGDYLGLAPGMEQNANMGFQSALDMYGQFVPQQMDVFQQGNVAAQGHLLAGMPQFNNAIMGLPVDYSAFQPTQLNYDASWAQQQLPQFITTGDLLGGQSQQPQAQGFGQGGGTNPYGFSNGGFWQQR
jgi:hypothetical protein